MLKGWVRLKLNIWTKNHSCSFYFSAKTILFTNYRCKYFVNTILRPTIMVHIHINAVKYNWNRISSKNQNPHFLDISFVYKPLTPLIQITLFNRPKIKPKDWNVVSRNSFNFKLIVSLSRVSFSSSSAALFLHQHPLLFIKRELPNYVL